MRVAVPQPTPPAVGPRYRWPSERHLTPIRCGHCGARLLLGDVPSAEYPIVDIACLVCSRAACELIHDAVQRPPTPAEWRALPPSGKRGPKPRARPPSTVTIIDHRRLHPCIDCGALVRDGVTRCAACQLELRRRNGQASRLLAILADGQPHHRLDLSRALEVSFDALRKLIRRARIDGHAVLRVTPGYYLLRGRS